MPPKKIENIYINNGGRNIGNWPAGKPVPGTNSFAMEKTKSWAGLKETLVFTSDAEAIASTESPNLTLHQISH